MKYFLAAWLLIMSHQALSFSNITTLVSAANISAANSIAQPVIKDYAQLPNKSLMSISPSAKRLAYRNKTDERDLMMVVDLATMKLVAAVDVAKVNPTNAYFIDDDLLILVAVNNKKIIGFKGRHNVSLAYAFNLKTKSIEQLLVPGYGIYSGQGNLGEVLGVSDDHKYAYMPAFADQNLYNLYKVNLFKRRKPKLVMKGGPDTTDFYLGPDGEVLARERFNNDTNEHRIEKRVNDEWITIYKETNPIATKRFSGFTPDYKNLVTMALDYDTDRWAYYSVSLEDGTFSAPIFTKTDKDVEHVIMDVNRVVHGVEYSGFEPTYEFLDPKLNALMKGIGQAMPDNSMTIASYTPDWSNIVFYMDGMMSSGDHLIFRNGGLDYIAPARPNIAPESVATIYQTSYSANDGLTIPALVTLPKGANLSSKSNLPTIMMPHGGPRSYDKAGFYWLAQYFAAKGYAVIQPQFRGSDGFGAEFIRKGLGEWGRKMQTDLDDGVAHFVNTGVVDSQRVCILGGSYGGYAALAGVSFSPELYKCAVSINGVADIERMMTIEKRRFGSDHWVVAYWEDSIASGKFNDKHLREISPVNHTAKVSVPVLLVHGELDQVVPVEQSKNMHDQLQDNDKDSTLLILPNSTHGLMHNEDRIKALTAIDAFLTKHL
jgi:pimeloyl-ACP methyl ester carboxylesterase